MTIISPNEGTSHNTLFLMITNGSDETVEVSIFPEYRSEATENRQIKAPTVPRMLLSDYLNAN